MRPFSKRCWIILFALALTGCKSADNSQSPVSSSPGATPSAAASASPATAPASPGSTIDPCALLTSEELKSVQGEELKQASRSDQQDPDYIITQCYYLLPTAANSVVVNLTMQKPGGKTTKDLWQKMFAESNEREQGDKEERAARPEKVSGLGQEGYWLASRVGGALYVLKKNTIFRISIGGAADLKTKLSRSKTLAGKALAR